MDHVLHIDEFRDENIQSYAIGAGIVPVARRPDGELVLLLAKEQHITNWRGSSKWSGFEGGRKADETIEDTACREWREESLMSVDGVEACVRRGAYVCRFTLNIVPPRNRSDARSNARYHVTYVVEVDFCEACVGRFADTRRQLLSIAHHRPGPSLGDDLSACAQDGPIQEDDVDQTIRQMRDAFVITRDDDGHDATIAVNRDFLEKECIQWWTLTDLRTVLQNGGRLGDEHFRTYFLPVLCGILTHLDTVR